MRRFLSTSLVLAAGCTAAALAWADEPKLPVKTDDGTILYVAPKIAPTEKSADTLGATIGVQRPSGAAAYGGMDTSGSRRSTRWAAAPAATPRSRPASNPTASRTTA